MLNCPNPSIKRYELKFYVSSLHARILRERFKWILTPDPNGPNGYGVDSVYFDSPDYHALHEKLAGSVIRKKYRVRSYDRGKKTFKLEMKARLGEATQKDSCTLGREMAEALLQGDFTAVLDSCRFHDDARARLVRKMVGDLLVGGYRPVTLIHYFREAWGYPWDCDNRFRVTLDQRMSQSRDWHSLLQQQGGTPGVPFMPAQTMILEVKFNQAFPEFLAPLFAGIPRLRSAISKYVYGVMGESDIGSWRA